MKDRSYSMHALSLEHYTKYAAQISEWEIYEMESATVVYNGCHDSIFNYVLCESDINADNANKVIAFLKEKGWEMTWTVEPNAYNLQNILGQHGIKRVSNPKKAFIEVDKFYYETNPNLNLSFVRVNSKDTIHQFDQITSDIYFHKMGIVPLFLRGLEHNKDSNIKAFIVKENNQTIGACSLFIDGKVATCYADCVYKKFRHRTIGSHMIAKRVQIAKEHGCETIIAQCMSQSVHMYERLGFRMMGTLYLYSSSP